MPSIDHEVKLSSHSVEWQIDCETPRGSISIVEGGSPVSNHLSSKMNVDEPVEETSAELYYDDEDLREDDSKLRLQIDDMENSEERLEATNSEDDSSQVDV